MADCSDEAVQATNDDASECKRCAVRLGYWHDPYISLIVKATDRKAPEINRGYYARHKGVGRFIDEFLSKTGTDCQILNLGAGFDTLYWRLVDSGRRIVNYIEVDFPTVTSRKCHLIKRNKQLLEKIHVEGWGNENWENLKKMTIPNGDGEIRLSATDLHATGYHIVGADLRSLKDLTAKLADSDVRFDLPTLILTECVLVYLEEKSSENLLCFFSEKFSAITIVNYEQINLCDRFGEVMLKNLRARGCPLAGANACQSLETQLNRLKMTGWSRVAGWDMVCIYNNLPAADRMRIESLELLDEQELLMQLFQHYCIVTANSDKGIALELT